MNRPKTAQMGAAETRRQGALLLAVATAVLKNLLENGLVSHGVTSSLGADAAVSALPPDRITIGADEKPGLNLFLYDIAPRGLFSVSQHNETVEGARRSALPRAIEMRYLLTAYGARDLDTEILLGYAVELFRQESALDGDRIRAILSSLSDTAGGKVIAPAVAALSAPHVGDLVADMTICPQQLDTEEISRLWSTLQARFRPSAAYKVTLELVHADRTG